jgi:proprotein convertase subtilisin/kexin type 5
MISDAVPTTASISIFTSALLKDSGFYADVNENFTNKISWGKGKGIKFFNDTCYST